MATLSVTTVNTGNSTTDFTATTGNTSGAKIVVSSSNGIAFYVNSSANVAFIDADVSSFNITTKLEVGTHLLGGFNFGNLALIEIDASANTYTQLVIQNANSGINASGDLIVTNDTGNDTVGYVDLGINSSTYSNASFNIGAAGDAYLYTSNGALAIGTAATGKDIVFHANGTTTAAQKMRIFATGNVSVASNN
jgi:hypothetical protein